MIKKISNILILLGILVLAFIYWPLVRLYFVTPPQYTPKSSNDFYITIPKIHAQAPVFANVDPWNPSVYRPILEHGVAQAKGTSLPGQPGTSFLFAHSSDYPWLITQYNTIFYKLGNLNRGDLIIIHRDGKVYNYKVTDKKTVWPSETQYLSPNPKTQLILQTCTPPGTALLRLLVFATPVK